jgi:hypothetical protein
MVERQARRALDRELRPDEIQRGFTLCEYDNGRPALQAFARRAVSKGFFAFTDERLFLIPLRVRDLMGFPFEEVEEIHLSMDELLTVSFGGGMVLGIRLADPTVGQSVMTRFQQIAAIGRETFEQVFRTADFDQRIREEMAKQLGRGLGRDAAIRQVALWTAQVVRSFGGDKAVAGAAAHAAVRIAARDAAEGDSVKLQRTQGAGAEFAECSHRFCRRRAGHRGAHNESRSWAGR